MAQLTDVRAPFGWMQKIELPVGQWVFCRALPVSGWWDADDALGALPSAVRCGRTLFDRTWVAVPESTWSVLAKMLAQSDHPTHVRGVVIR